LFDILILPPSSFRLHRLSWFRVHPWFFFTYRQTGFRKRRTAHALQDAAARQLRPVFGQAQKV